MKTDVFFRDFPESIINEFNNDPEHNINLINNYFKKQLIKFGIPLVVTFKNNELSYSTVDTPEAVVIRTLKKDGKEIKSISSIGTSINSPGDWKSIEFSVTLQDDSQLKGELTRNGDN
jgi:hypothetical protein